MKCAAKAAQYMRTYERRKVMNAKKVATAETDSGQKPDGVLTTSLVLPVCNRVAAPAGDEPALTTE